MNWFIWISLRRCVRNDDQDISISSGFLFFFFFFIIFISFALVLVLLLKWLISCPYWPWAVWHIQYFLCCYFIWFGWLIEIELGCDLIGSFTCVSFSKVIDGFLWHRSTHFHWIWLNSIIYFLWYFFCSSIGSE